MKFTAWVQQNTTREHLLVREKVAEFRSRSDAIFSALQDPVKMAKRLEICATTLLRAFGSCSVVRVVGYLRPNSATLVGGFLPTQWDQLMFGNLITACIWVHCAVCNPD